MFPELVRALGALVFGGVEERLVVRRPGDRRDPLPPHRQQLAGVQVFDLQGILAKAGGIGGEGVEAIVLAQRHGADRHEGFILGQPVHVEQDVLWRRCLTGSGLTAQDRVLLAGFGAAVIEPAAQPVRHGQVGFLDAPQHFPVERVLERFERPGDCCGVGVLGLQVVDHRRVLLVAQPVVVVYPLIAVLAQQCGVLGRDRRVGGLGVEGCQCRQCHF